MLENPTPNLKILRLKQLQMRIQQSRSTIYDRLNPKSPRFDSKFPRPIKLSALSIGWIVAETDEWLIGRIAVSRSGGRPAHAKRVTQICAITLQTTG
ncbi:helix-turn-helix transcriptional regulator [Undibacterium sp. TJN25]|uniref:helix-turn-helix transcriptional regulator n=1 Tax=Undibacterium sp. TJN25 TaxID=3413056 RepID=UPI003BF01CD6